MENKNDLDVDVAASVEAELNADTSPLILREMTEDGRAALVSYIIDKLEALGVDPRSEYAELNDDDDDEDDEGFDEDDDDDFDDDEDDRWPGDSDEDEE